MQGGGDLNRANNQQDLQCDAACQQPVAPGIALQYGVAIADILALGTCLRQAVVRSKRLWWKQTQSSRE